MPDFTSYSSGFGTIHLLAKTIHLVSVLVSVFHARSGDISPKYLLIKSLNWGSESSALCSDFRAHSCTEMQEIKAE